MINVKRVPILYLCLSFVFHIHFTIEAMVYIIVVVVVKKKKTQGWLYFKKKVYKQRKNSELYR